MKNRAGSSLSTIYTLLCSLSYSSPQQLVSAFTVPRRQHQHSPRELLDYSSAKTTDTIMPDNENKESNPLVERGLPSPLLLGSASFTRKLILSEMNIPYHKVVRPIDEKSLGDRTKDAPNDLVLTLALAKMDHLVREIQSGKCVEDMPSKNSDGDNNGDSSVTDNDEEEEEWIVLTGDQVVTHAGKILEKPESVEQAKEFVQGYGNEPCSTVGSCVLTHLPSNIQVSGVDTATIHFRPTISGDLVDRLLAEEAPILCCAGGLMIEHPLVKEHIEKIDGTEDSVMGLSKDLVERLLDELKEKLDDIK